MKLYRADTTSISVGGETIDRAEDGSFDVPVEATSDTFAHLIEIGFTTVPPEVPEKEAHIPTGNPAQWKADVLEAEAIRLGVDITLTRQEVLSAVAAARKAEREALENE
jgi:hypothetical protein